MTLHWQVVQQLQLMGEVVYLKAEAQDLVVLDPAWLTHQQIGHLLSTQYATHARVTGRMGIQVMPSAISCNLLCLMEWKRLHERLYASSCQTWH